jgi:hypothetical protein
MNPPIVWRDILSVVVTEDRSHVVVTLDCPGEKHQVLVPVKYFWHRRSSEMMCSQCSEKPPTTPGGDAA